MTAPLRGLGPYSLSGVPLDGNKIVRLVYIDEAGISKPAQEPFLVVAGVIVDADRVLHEIENELECIMLRHIPPAHREGFIFHATELFNGGGNVFKRAPNDLIGPYEWPLERRLKIADEIMAIPQKFQLPIAIGSVERPDFQERFPHMPERERTVSAHAIAFMLCSLFVEHWMRKETINEICLLVVENNDLAKKMIRDAHKSHQSETVVENITNKSLADRYRIHFPLRKIKEDPLFQSKRQSSALIVADFCAYVMKRNLMKDHRYDRFVAPIKKHLVVYEPAL